MVAKPRGELHVAQLLQPATDRPFVERGRNFIMDPVAQIDQPPAHDPVDRRNLTALDNIDQCLALYIVEPRTRGRRLAIQQAVGTSGFKPEHPVPHDLMPNSADPSRCGPTASSKISARGNSRRAWFVLFVIRDNRRNAAPLKSSRKPIAEPMAPYSKAGTP